MQHSRRQARALLAAATAAAALPGNGIAQTFPSRPVRIIVPFGPGGVADILARLIAPSWRSASASPWPSALPDLIGGPVQLMFGDAPPSLPHVRAVAARG